MEIVAVIPARFASTRLPGKPLLAETGRPLIQHVVEAARRARRLNRVIVATDDVRIAEAVTEFGGEYMMTSENHPTGTDRVAEVAAGLPGARIVVNLQGDEPEVSGHALDLVVSLLEDDPEVPMATLATPIRSDAVYRDPSCVKVVRCTVGPRPLFLEESDPLPSRRPGQTQARPFSTWASTPTAATSCSDWPSSPPHRSSGPRSWSNSAFSKRGTRSPSGSLRSRASGSTRPRITTGSSNGVVPGDEASLETSARSRRAHPVFRGCPQHQPGGAYTGRASSRRNSSDRESSWSSRRISGWVERSHGLPIRAARSGYPDSVFPWFSEATCWIISSSFRKSTGLVRWAAKPTSRLRRTSWSRPNPVRAIPLIAPRSRI